MLLFRPAGLFGTTKVDGSERRIIETRSAHECTIVSALSASPRDDAHRARVVACLGVGTGRSARLWVLGTSPSSLYIPTKTETSTIGDMTFAFQLALAAMSLNLVMGYGGIVSLGHSAFFGLGGYTTAVLFDEYGWSQGWTILAGAVIAFVVGVLVSLPALRLHGVYLALVTLGVAVLFPTLVRWKKLEWLTQVRAASTASPTTTIPQLPFVRRRLAAREARAVFMYWLAVLALVVSYLVCRGLVKSRVGRSLVAIRDNETAAAVMGVNRRPHQDAGVRRVGLDVRRRRLDVRDPAATSSTRATSATSRSSAASSSWS